MSNEKREQQMMTEAKVYTSEFYDNESASFKVKEKIAETIADFCAGWRAADAHPAWVSVDDELPESNIYPEGKTFPLVLVCLNDGCEDTDAYDTDNKTWCKYGDEVEYWMPLPTPPVKKGGEL